MSDGTKISWTQATWNPIRARRRDGQPNKASGGWACQRVSDGCVNCYAAGINQRLGTGLDYDAKGIAASDIYLDERILTEPLRWKKSRLVFVCSMTDLFAEWVPDGYIVAVWMTMAKAWQHTFQVLTKRPERMRDFVARWSDHTGEDFDFRGLRGPQAVREAHPSGRGQLFASYLDWLGSTTGGEPPEGAAWPTFDWSEGPLRWSYRPGANVHLGVSVENQRAADERIPELLATPAAVRWLSCEPLLGAVDVQQYLHDSDCWPVFRDPPAGLCICNEPREDHISWVVVGGESGRDARPCDTDWIRGIVRQCQAARVPVFTKQGGASNRCVHDRKGGHFECFPADLKVREYPHAK